MPSRLRKNLISIMLIACIVAAALFVPPLSEDGVYAAKKPAQAKLSKSKITIPSSMIAYKKFTITLTGDRQSIKKPASGETRYIPYSYVIKHSDGKIYSPKGLKPNKSGKYSYSIQFTDPGNKVITVTWRKQKYKNKKWYNTSTKGSTKKTLVIKGTLKYDPTGGTVSTKSKYLKQNATAGTLPTPTRPGYKFNAWSTKSSGGTKIQSSTKITFTSSTKTIYAQWTAVNNSYTPVDPGGDNISPIKNGDYISSFDSTAKSIITKIGTQGKSQCAAYCMSFCTAIKSKKYVAPTDYLNSDNLAVWDRGGMNRLKYSSSEDNHAKAMTFIKKQIDNGLPCIIRCNYWTSTRTKGEHWVTVIGYKPRASIYSDLYVLDPSLDDVTEVRLFFDTKYYFPWDNDVGIAYY